MADRQGVEVSGLPSFLDDSDFIKDKLLIHFLQRKNGGGCDVTVQYPTEKAGTALLVFEDKKVAQRILSRTHSLIIEACIYPLDVRRPQPRGSSFSMPVKTSLDLSYFSNVREVRRLLEWHRLSIYRDGGGVLGIEGDFGDLTSCRLELYKILSRRDLADKHGSLESTTGEHLHSERRGGRALKSVTPASEQKSPSSHPSKILPKENVAQDSVARSHGNNLGGSTQRSSSSTAHQKPSTRSARPPMSTRGQKPPGSLSQLFLVDPAVHRYVTTFRQDKIDNLLRQHNIDMKEQNGEGFISITLTSLAPAQPEHFEEACSEIKELYNHYNKRLRTENIELPTSSRLSNEEMTEIIQKYLLKQNICSLQVDDTTLCIIGTSDKTLNFLQEWRGSRGQLARDIIGETLGSGSARSPTIGLDSEDLVRSGKNSTQPGMSDGRAKGHEGGHDAHNRRKEISMEKRGRRAPQGITLAIEQEMSSSSSSPSHLSRPPEDRRYMAQDHMNNFGSQTQPSSLSTGPHTSSSTTSAKPPTHDQKASTLRSPSCSFSVDSAVHTYVRKFRQDKVDHLLRQHNIDMKKQNGEDFISITLTSLAAAQPEDHEKACSEIKEIYNYYDNHLQKETIEFPTGSNEEITRMIQRYLLAHEICLLSVDANVLHVIGPSEEVLKFKQRWRGTRMVQNIIGETSGSGRTRSPAIGMDSEDSNSKNSTQPRASNRKGTGCEGGHDAHSSGREKISMEKLSSLQSLAERYPISEEKGRRALQGVTPTPKQEIPSHPSRKPPDDRQPLALDHKNNLDSPTQPSSPGPGPYTSSTTSARPPTHGQKPSSLRSPSYSFHIDPAVHTYVNTFRKKLIEKLLRHHKFHMKEQNDESFTSITLTSLEAAQPEYFEEACSAIKDTYNYYGNHLQRETIELPTGFNEEILITIQRYLLDREICLLSVTTNALHVIGPSEEVRQFKLWWRGTRMAQNIMGETPGSGSARSSALTLDSKNLARNSKNLTQPGASDGRTRWREGSHDAYERGKEKTQDGPGSARGRSSPNHRREPWK